MAARACAAALQSGGVSKARPQSAARAEQPPGKAEHAGKP